jgi:hypothetical protein
MKGIRNKQEQERNIELSRVLLESWEAIKNDVKSQVGSRAFEMWIRPLKLLGVEGPRLLLSIPNLHFSEVAKHYGATILRSAADAGLAVTQIDLSTQN